MRGWQLWAAGWLALTVTIPVTATASPDSRPRVVVLSDIGNEPDDSQSLVRLLLYANELSVEGLVATTSTWQRDRVQRPLIDERIAAYGLVRNRLARHALGYPTAAALAAVVRSGRPSYGMAGVGKGKDTDASRLIVAAVDRDDPRPLWVLCWGGAVDLAQALWTVRAQRSPEAVARFVTRLRVYSISDQDDAGPWLRRSFPKLFWIASIHGWGQYNMATWTGISGDRRNGERWPDGDTVSNAWLSANVRRGPLGSLYPLPTFIMEGDTPSLLHLLPTGLGDLDHPEHGGWGGRYMRSDPGNGHFGDVKDTVAFAGGVLSSNQASVFRWRRAFQNDFAARVGWSLTADRAAANHPPQPMLQRTSGTAPVRVGATSGTTVALDARGSHDPDGDALTVRWWQYREVGGVGTQPGVTIARPDALRTDFVAPAVSSPVTLHIILEVQDHGTPALTRYRRLLVDIRPRETS